LQLEQVPLPASPSAHVPLLHVQVSQLLPKWPAAQVAHDAPAKPAAQVHAPVPVRPVSQLPWEPHAQGAQLAP
jgi:hypothetical protein